MPGTAGSTETVEGVLALFQIRTERRRRWEKDAADRAERHRAQARLVSGVLGPEEEQDDPMLPSETALPRSKVKRPRTGINLLNASDEPVHSPVVAIVFIQGAGPRTMEEQLKLARSQEREGFSPPFYYPQHPAPRKISGLDLRNGLGRDPVWPLRCGHRIY